MLSDLQLIHQRVEQMKQVCAQRDADADRVRLVRQGRIDELHADFFADDLPKSIVANIIDTAARDTAELMAPLPSLACASGNMTTASDEQRAGKKNKIGSYFWKKSRLSVQNIPFCDSINSYAFGTYIVEPDFECRLPRIRFENSFGAYYFKDRWGNLVWYAKESDVDVATLVSSYPEHQAQILSTDQGLQRALTDKVKLVTYYDRKRWVVYLPDCKFLTLATAVNPIDRIPVVIAERPDVEERPRGQYDDTVWPALAKARMAMYMLKAADFAVNAPWTMPDDVTEISLGPDAVLRSQNPQQIGKVQLRIPQDVFALAAELDKGAKEGARYPEARTGGVTGNIITGRGVQALMGTMDTQVQTMQTIVAEALEEVTSICFEMDAALWPHEKKTITGVLTGKPFELSYTPAKDIGESHDCKVTYGFAAGQSPAQAMVALLQLRGDDQISRDTARRQLPFDIDAEEEQRSVDAQQLEDALKQGLSALLQSMGPMVLQGQDPLPVITKAAKVIQERQKGKALYQAILDSFDEEKNEPPGPEEAEPGAPGAGGPQDPNAAGPQDPNAPPGPGGGGNLPPGVRDNGLMQGVAYGQAGQAPGGMPSVQSLMSRLRGNGDMQMEASRNVKKPTA